MELIQSFVAGITGAVGAYSAVLVHLKWHKSQLDELKEAEKRHSDKIHELDKRTASCRV